ncbi:MAG: hypothetical protein M3O20_05385 [Acidobacteriota bacterium]|nr:hypothetical protein [Acidobacteriota bacterium]
MTPGSSRLGLGPSLEPAQPENKIEYLAWFRFPVTWNYLNGYSPQAGMPSRVTPVAKPLASTVVALASTVTEPRVEESTVIDTTQDRVSRPLAAKAQWEMVIPKMVRPAAQPVAERMVAAPPAPPVISAAATVDDAARSVAAEYSSPAFALPEQSRLARSWRLIALLSVIILAGGFTLWDRPDASVTRREQVEESLHRGGWSRRSLLPPGRMMSVYEGSREEPDYRLEFAWVPDAKGVGWVFRTRDAGDYYATRISLLQPGARVVLVVEHFSVFRGVEGQHVRRVVPLGGGAGLVRVRMDAIGPVFTLSLQGSAADYWTDARLDSGPLGFYDERGQRPDVQSLRFTFLKKGAARTAVASLP